MRADAAHPSNWRSFAVLDRWLKTHNIPAISGIDTRALASRIREKGMPHGVIAHGDVEAATLVREARAFVGLEGLDLAKDVSGRQTRKWRQTPWVWGEGYGEAQGDDVPRRRPSTMASSTISCASWPASAPT